MMMNNEALLRYSLFGRGLFWFSSLLLFYESVDYKYVSYAMPCLACDVRNMIIILMRIHGKLYPKCFIDGVGE